MRKMYMKKKREKENKKQKNQKRKKEKKFNNIIGLLFLSPHFHHTRAHTHATAHANAITRVHTQRETGDLTWKGERSKTSIKTFTI